MRKLIVGNWKMHGTIADNEALLQGLFTNCRSNDIDWVVCPPSPYLLQCKQLLQGSRIALGAQQSSEFASGAYTGQVSAEMLFDLSCQYVIIGHSESRAYFRHTNTQIAAQAQAAIQAGLSAIVCIGESASQRDLGNTAAMIEDQLAPVLANVDVMLGAKLVIAYEPIWAIGSGKAAGPEDISSVHFLVRKLLHEKGAKFSNSVRILYGGSVKPSNAAALLTLDQVDGLLIGGASLDPIAFSEIGQCKF